MKIAPVLAVGAVLVLAACGSTSAPGANDPGCPAVMTAVPATAPASYNDALAVVKAAGEAESAAGLSAKLRPLVIAAIKAASAIQKADIGLGQASGDQLAAYDAARRKLAAYCG